MYHCNVNVSAPFWTNRVPPGPICFASRKHSNLTLSNVFRSAHISCCFSPPPFSLLTIRFSYVKNKRKINNRKVSPNITITVPLSTIPPILLVPEFDSSVNFADCCYLSDHVVLRQLSRVNFQYAHAQTKYVLLLSKSDSN